MATIVGFDVGRYESFVIHVPVDSIVTNGEYDSNKGLHACLMHLIKEYDPVGYTKEQLEAWAKMSPDELCDEMDDLNECYLVAMFEENIEDMS